MYKVEFARVPLKEDFYLAKTEGLLALRDKWKTVASAEVDSTTADSNVTEFRSATQTAILIALANLFGKGTAFAFLRDFDGGHFGCIVFANGKNKHGIVCATVTRTK